VLLVVAAPHQRVGVAGRRGRRKVHGGGEGRETVAERVAASAARAADEHIDGNEGVYRWLADPAPRTVRVGRAPRAVVGRGADEGRADRRGGARVHPSL